MSKRINLVKIEARKKIISMKIDVYGIDGATAGNEMADVGTWAELERDLIAFAEGVLDLIDEEQS